MGEWRHETLGFGDPRALPGTAEWAKRWRLEFHGAAIDLDTNPELVAAKYRLGEKFHAWELLTDRNGKPFASFEAFCETPMPFGAGVSAKKVRAYITMVEGKAAALEFAASVATPAPSKKQTTAPQVEKGRKGFKPQSNGCADRTTVKRGETIEYLTARIARERPDILEAMKHGAFPSVRAAARAAGILKPVDPVRAALRAFEKLSTEQRCAFFEAIQYAGDV